MQNGSQMALQSHSFSLIRSVQASTDFWEDSKSSVCLGEKQESERTSGIMNRNRTLLLGGLIGALTGVIGAMMLNRRAEKTGTELSLTTGEGMKLGVMVIGLLR